MAHILIFSALGSIGALTGAAVLLVFPKLHDLFRTPLLAYAVGTLLGAVFVGLLPEAIEQHKEAGPILLTVLIGLFGFSFWKRSFGFHIRTDKHGRVTPANPHITR